MKELPPFTKQPLEWVMRFAIQMFTHPNQPEKTYFRRIIAYDDGHFGAVFALDYFEGTETPTKSQWNSLKKKFKRHDKRVFVLKEQNIVACDVDSDLLRCGKIEFGFLPEFNSGK